MEAERDAALIVQQARDYRTQKLKQARTDAQKEVDEIKQAKETTFKEMQEKVGCTIPKASVLTTYQVHRYPIHTQEASSAGYREVNEGAGSAI